MKLEFKDRFDETAAQWQRFWDGTNSRPAVRAVLPKRGTTPVEHPGWFSVMPERDPGPAIDQLLNYAETHEFLCEAIPFYYLEFASDHFAALLGADLTFTGLNRGGWAVPFLKDLAHPDIHFDRDGYWWKQTVELAQALRSRCDGKLLIASPTLVSNLDALAALYGPENLVLSMMDEPDSVHAALRQIDRAHGEILDALAELLDYKSMGSINRHGMYSTGRVNVPQCDFSCMISPAMFQEFVIPYLQREMQRLDAVEYHLDGPGAIKHLPALCGLEELSLIQWVPGAGEPLKRDWSDLYSQIDDFGKGQLREAGTDETKRLWQGCRTRTLYVMLQSNSKTEVEDCMAELEKITPAKPDAGHV